MNPTKLLYLTDMQTTTGNAHVNAVEINQDTATVYLDQTLFYPQGGGQPFDTGTIKNDHATFMVHETRYIDGNVAHKGYFDGPTLFKAHEAVLCLVNTDRRTLNSRLHTAGHIVDMAVDQLSLAWKPLKAYHFPDSPYVEYSGSFEPEKIESLRAALQQSCNAFIQKNLPVSCCFATTIEEVTTLCQSVPAGFLERGVHADKPLRIIRIDSFGVPCGGTHVQSLKEIGSMTITKIKKKDTTIRVGYDVVRS